MRNDLKSVADCYAPGAMWNPVTTEISPATGLIAFPEVTRVTRNVSFSDRQITKECDRATRILVIGDDPVDGDPAIGYLEECGMRVTVVVSRHDAMRHILLGEPSLIVVRLSSWRQYSLDLVKEIRSRFDISMVILNSERHNETDCVIALELGADDYISRSCALRELRARIYAILRRRNAAHTELRRDSERGGYRFGCWTLDRRLRRLATMRGDNIVLTKGEYALLVAFLDSPRRPLTREFLLRATRVREDIFDRSIDVQVLRLRRKLETDANAPRVIRAERGVGYVFDVPVEKLHTV
jgi:DNA-binding response OmpR family regulator